MTNYIVACYMGKRRQDDSKLKSTPLTYIKNHINWLATAQYVDKALFVFNDASHIRFNQQSKAIQLVSQAGYDYIVRDNINFSYGAWEEGIKHTLNYSKCNYSFLIEDDYIPSIPSTLNYYIKCMDKNIGFVSSLYSYKDKPHAAISNGLISHKAVREIISKDKNIFLLHDHNPKHIKNPNIIGKGQPLKFNKIYPVAIYNQRNFLGNMLEIGYKVTDITNENYTKFFESGDTFFGVHLHGNDNGICLVEPNFPIPLNTPNYWFDSYKHLRYIPPKIKI